MGHVNNAVYSTYLEEARIGVLGDLIDFILARVEIDFRSELRMGEEVEVGSRCSRIGTKSFDLEHVISASGGRVVAEAKSSSSPTTTSSAPARRFRTRCASACRPDLGLRRSGGPSSTFTVTSLGPRLSISSRSTSSPGLRVASSFARSAAESIGTSSAADDHVADGQVGVLARAARIDDCDRGAADRGVEPELDGGRVGVDRVERDAEPRLRLGRLVADPLDHRQRPVDRDREADVLGLGEPDAGGVDPDEAAEPVDERARRSCRG